MHRIRVVLLAIAVAVAAWFGSSSPAVALAVPGQHLGPWTLTSARLVSSAHADQGVATAQRADGSTTSVTRGRADVPIELARQGWIHIGDPDSRAGWTVDAFQGTASLKAKLFVVTAPDGSRTYLRHPLATGESFHNSFAAISPDGRWFVAGEWGTISRLLVFAMPGAGASHRTVRLAGTIALQRPVNDVQGCVFASSQTLLCSSSDRSTTRFAGTDPLLGLRLQAPLRSPATRAAVTYLGAIPQDPSCTAVGETEGLDLHAGVLRIALNSPCRAGTLLETFGVGDSAHLDLPPETSSFHANPAVVESSARRGTARRERT